MQRGAAVILQPAGLHNTARPRIKRFKRLRKAFALHRVHSAALEHPRRVGLAIVGKVGDRREMLVVVVLVFQRHLAA